MATLAYKSPGPGSAGMGTGMMMNGRDYASSTSTRTLTAAHNNSFASPTESEFSEVFDGQDSVRAWDEKRVAEWLKSINCGQYTEAFKANHVNGSNLVECDQMVLKEMGIKKIGDRVRISVGIKALRNKAVPNQSKRNRDSIAVLDSRAVFTPSSASTSSPRSGHTRDRSYNPPLTNRRISRHNDSGLGGDRPSSPLVDPETRTRNPYRMDTPRRENTSSSFSSSAKSASGKRPEGMTPSGPPHMRRNLSTDATVSKLPATQPLVRVIHAGGDYKVVDIKGCRTGDQIIQNTLRKLGLPENHVNSYCFYTVDEHCQPGENCRRVTDLELSCICTDLTRPERGRLILRRIHHGEPTYEEVEKARSFYRDEHYERDMKMNENILRHPSKIMQITGEPLEKLSPTYPEFPARKPVGSGTTERVKREVTSRAPLKPVKQFQGQRPESGLISQELATYFPNHGPDEIQRTVKSAERRSQRISRIMNRLSMASNSSLLSNSLSDAPPVPTLSKEWLNASGGKVARPLSVSRFPSSWRDSMASATQLQTLAEESSEPNRKSYVSFDSGSDVAGTGDDQATISSNTELTTALAEDGEGPDPELEQFLQGDSWDKLKWMKGSLIGQGSFGSVYLALHAVTGELMAVKQVEMPSKNNNEMNKKKEGMVQALQREINLLEKLQHPHIVKYFGSNYHDDHFNIFLEYVPGGSVAAMLNNYGQLTEQLIRNFVRQILEGLAYLHAQDIIHRDIKGANVLVDNKGQVKISDFGISKRVEVSALTNPAKGGHLHRPSLQGSVFWMAPEVVKQTSYTLKADIWSLGCLVVEMFTGEHPFPDYNQMQAIFQIGASAKPATPEAASEEGKAFLAQTFEVDHEKRPSARELMNSPFLKQLAEG